MSAAEADGIAHSDFSQNPYEPRNEASEPEPRAHNLTRRFLGYSPAPSRQSAHGGASTRRVQDDSVTARVLEHVESKAMFDPAPRPVKDEKLGTLAGVFVPTALNVFSVLMFLRFGFILGQTGILGMMAMLVVCYLINLITILSLSAIATNGTVRGGGAYYLISRSLGPEFGGSIGVVFYLAQVFNTGLNAVGLVDCVKLNFGSLSGNWGSWLKEGFWWQYLWGTAVLVICTLICCAGSGIFARAGNGLLLILMLSTLSIPLSALVQSGFKDPNAGIVYTGLSLKTLRENLLPHFTKGAAGSQLKTRENFQSLFGILYPATSGIFAGASMSGSLKHPSKAIPKGTLYGVGLTFVLYTLVILSLAATITRETLYVNGHVLQETSLSGVLILMGELACSLFSTLMGIVGAANLLQALARDSLLPGADIFGKGILSEDIPIFGILLTYVLTQLTLLGDINQIATLVTMGYLMTFLVMNLACFLLKIGSAPNFRPSFRYFNWYTALFGTLGSGASMFFVDGWAASGCVLLLIALFILIHYTTPPKAWGDVSQSLIYHQVRKYLLRLKQEHVKFWRPQILLFVNDPRRSYKMIQFCNSLKKGGLFVLGHVIVTPDFELNVHEARKQQQKWNKYIDLSRIKAFVQIVISPSAEWGTRNLVLSAGLGGMKPNIIIMGFYNLELFRESRLPVGDLRPDSDRDDPDSGLPASQELPTDDNRQEPDITPSTYVTILEDLLLGLHINVAIGRNFSSLQLPHQKDRKGKKYIDLWPIQMSAEISAEGASSNNVLTTNFDTYTLILQLGCILTTVPAWKKVYDLRVNVFVEYESELEEERGRLQTLLDNLRIRAKVRVFWLASGDCNSYKAIVNGDISSASSSLIAEIDEALKDEDWWKDMRLLRSQSGGQSAQFEHSDTANRRSSTAASITSRRMSTPNTSFDGFEGLRRVLRRADRRRSAYQLNQRRSSMSIVSNAPRMTMTTHRLPDDMIQNHAIHDSASEDGDSIDDLVSTAEATESEDDAVSESSQLLPARSATQAEIPAIHQLSNWPPFRSRKHGESEPEDDVSLFNQRSEIYAFQSHSDAVVPQLKDQVNKEQASIERRSRKKGKDTPKRHSRSASPLQENSPRRQPLRNYGSLDTAVESAGPSREPSRPPTAISEKPPSIRRPRASRHASTAKFTSKPVPQTKVAADDGPGPSIMFTESIERPDSSRPIRSIYERNLTAVSHLGDAGRSDLEDQLSVQSVPLSFNDLPCRAQHLILNELMRRKSRETAALFTTLPSPASGTGKSEDDSVEYLGDLEVLCRGLPPTLLVHSNSMTVTTNL